jgi:ElaB/YqjD/DUF883 family membrane-anchored ribosome-binding protein
VDDIRKTEKKASEGVSKAQSAAEHLSGDLKATGRETSEKIQENLRSAKAKGQAAWDEAKSQGEEAWDDVSDAAEEGMGQVRRFFQRRPVQIVGAALLVGVVVGAIIFRASRNTE